MKKIITALLLLITSVGVISCSDLNNQDMGTISGGVIGGLVGSRFGGGSGQLVATGAGALLGAYIGGKLGQSMDQADRMKMNNALESNATGQPAYWQNQKSGTTYSVTPVKNVTVDNNPYCREYRTTANIGGKVQQVYGTACRQPDGAWKAVS